MHLKKNCFSRFSIAVFTAALFVVFTSAVNAAPPRKDICPAPKTTAQRQAAVKKACKYFNQVPQSWGLHSAFNARGKVITCIHFSCRTVRTLTPKKIKRF
jgi:hypothetical protein